MRKIAYVVIAIVLLFAFDHAMRKDAERLCSNDATAYDECSWQGNR